MLSITADAGGLPKPESLDRLERHLGRDLPPSYRSFLLTHNGGTPDPDHFLILGMPGNPFGEIRKFLGLETGKSYDDIEQVLADFDDRVPSHLLPIGYSSTGDLICLSLREDDYGSVYFFDATADTRPALGTPSGISNLYFVAKDFDSFLAGLNTYEHFEELTIDDR